MPAPDGKCLADAAPMSTLPPLALEDDALGAVAREVSADATTPRERAVGAQRWVRDEIAFGFTARFDAADPALTLAARRGHGVPKAAVLLQLLHALDVPARVRFLSLKGDVLEGLFPSGLGPPETIVHAIVEARLDKAWVPTDAFAVDAPFFEAARVRCLAAGQTRGFGVHVDGTLCWDGKAPAYVQRVEDDQVVADLGVTEEPLHFVHSSAYPNPLAGLGRALYTLAVPVTNRAIARLRAGR